MTRPIRIAVNMQPATDGANPPQFKAALPMGVLFEKSLDAAELERERTVLEEKYSALVETLRSMRPQLKEANVDRNWAFGDAIVTFEQETSDALLFVDKLTDNLARDLNYSKSMIDLCRRFRLKVPDSKLIDPKVSFAAYHRSGFDVQRARHYVRK